MEKIKYIMTKPITMLVVIFIIVNLFTLFEYNIENNERKCSIKIINKIEQNKKLKLKEIEEDKLVVEELIGNRFDEYPLLNNIEVKNIENNIKKNRSLKYTIKNNSKNDIYITSEVLKRTTNGKVEIPLIDFVGYKKIIKQSEEVNLEIYPINIGYINSTHDILTKGIYVLNDANNKNNNIIKPIGYIQIKY